MNKVLNYTVKKLLGFLVLQSEINQDTLFYYNFFNNYVRDYRWSARYYLNTTLFRYKQI